jgi:hypothetical protein
MQRIRGMASLKKWCAFIIKHNDEKLLEFLNMWCDFFLKIFKKTKTNNNKKTAHYLSSRELILREEYIDIKFSAYDAFLE